MPQNPFTEHTADCDQGAGLCFTAEQWEADPIELPNIQSQFMHGRMLLTILQATERDTTLDVGTIILCPLSGHDGSLTVSALFYTDWGVLFTFEELLAGVLLEQRLMSHWGLEVVDHEIEDRSDVLLSIPSELSESCVLTIVSPVAARGVL